MHDGKTNTLQFSKLVRYSLKQSQRFCSECLCSQCLCYCKHFKPNQWLLVHISTIIINLNKMVYLSPLFDLSNTMNCLLKDKQWNTPHIHCPGPLGKWYPNTTQRYNIFFRWRKGVKVVLKMLTFCKVNRTEYSGNARGHPVATSCNMFDNVRQLSAMLDSTLQPCLTSTSRKGMLEFCLIQSRVSGN